MKAEYDINKIKEFFDLLCSDKIYELRKYGHPVLVYEIVDQNIRFSIWEESILQRFDLKNVDGWDYEESSLFAPDWMLDDDFDDDDDFNDDDEI